MYIIYINLHNSLLLNFGPCKMNFVPSVKHSSMVNVVKQVRLQQEQAQKDFLMMVQLQPDESYAFSFVVIVAADDASPTVPTTIGYPQVCRTNP